MKSIHLTQKAVVVNKDGKILAVRRSKTAPTRPLHWDLPGGELDWGEDPTEGIKREIKEETGLKVAQVAPFDIIARVYESGEYWISLGYKAVSRSIKVRLSYEHDQWKWGTAQEFLKLKISAKIKRFVRKARL